MANYYIFKETALPASLTANSIYLIAPAADPNYLEIYVTDNAGSATRHAPTKTEIEGWISAAVAAQSSVEVVADIAARDALTLTVNTKVLVLDATGDATVASGAATYIYDAGTTSFTKISEEESMDVTLTWAAITGKPTSAVADIDDAVTKRHTHANKTELDKIGEDGDGDLTYNGASVRISWDSTNW